MWLVCVCVYVTMSLVGLLRHFKNLETQSAAQMPQLNPKKENQLEPLIVKIKAGGSFLLSDTPALSLSSSILTTFFLLFAFFFLDELWDWKNERDLESGPECKCCVRRWHEQRRGATQNGYYHSRRPFADITLSLLCLPLAFISC